MISMPELVEKFNTFILRVFPNAVHGYHISLDRYLNNKRRHDDIAPANFKEMVNNIAPRVVSDAFLSEMLKELNMKEDDECKKLFMNPEQIRALASMGFFVEHHTHNHYSLDREPIEVLREDFGVATNILRGILGKSPCVMAYPYGRSPKDFEILTEYGITHGVTVEHKSIIASDDAFLIPRFDTNDVKNFLDTNG
jgi:carbamoylphosphate synthase small subunit